MCSLSDCMIWVAGMFCPPLAVFLITGDIGEDFWINVCLTLLAYLPGHMHLFYVSYVYRWKPRIDRWSHIADIGRFSSKKKTAPAPRPLGPNNATLEKPDEIGPGESRGPALGPGGRQYVRRPSPGPGPRPGRGGKF